MYKQAEKKNTLPNREEGHRDRQSISVVIPTLNEEQHVEETLRSVRKGGSGVEILVVDGGSNDATVEQAKELADRVLRGPRGRGRQMNRGAKAANGDLLLFLHADTRVPPNFDHVIRSTLRENGVVAGCFRLTIDAEHAGLTLIEWAANMRSRLIQLPYGDQGLFLRKDTFRSNCGFPEQSLMEDLELVCRLRRKGRIRTSPVPVKTAPRRWEQNGIIANTFYNQMLLTGYFLGVSPDHLAKWYFDSSPENDEN